MPQNSNNKLISIIFRLIFFSMLTLNYINFVFLIWIPSSLKNPINIILIIIFHIFFGITLWAIYITVISDPGQVPLYWGFYIGDPDSMRCRYCLMCNVFKPVRCHHCSMCNRCVLNMDHHCPWINNCIGFYNRKYFIQMVFYLNCTLIFVICCNFMFVYDIVLKYLLVKKIVFNLNFFFKMGYIVFYLMDILMEIILFQFFKFHIKLILENKTTIETLEHKGKEFNSKFDRGKWENWIEVMGINRYLWFFPLKYYYGKPKGNGIDWIENPNVLIQEENNENNLNEENNNNDFNKREIEMVENVNNNNNQDRTGVTSSRNPPGLRNISRDNSQISGLTRNAGHSSMSSLYQ